LTARHPVLGAAVLALAACGAVAQVEPKGAQVNAPFVTTPAEVVSRMLALAGVAKGDVVYDLGCGDGRIVIEAARHFGVRGVGIDLNPLRIAEAREAARRAGVAGLVEFREQDLFDADLREATVVTLYLLPPVNLALRPKLLAELRPGTRVVSHAFHMGDWKPDREVAFGDARIYRWTVPPAAAGAASGR
jgi:SAM-dependent methyltransferase